MSPDRSQDLTIRMLDDHDRSAIQQLAERDSARAPALPALGAESEGRLIAALSLAGGEVVADPFLPTGAAADLLRLRAGQLGATRGMRRLRLPRRHRSRAALAGERPLPI